MYPRERSLVKRLENQPFALLGVNSDSDLEQLRPVLERENITWRSFWNGPEGTGGPISTKWNVSGWPTVYILDREGVIRYKGHSLPEELVDEFLAEMGDDGGDDDADSDVEDEAG